METGMVKQARSDQGHNHLKPMKYDLQTQRHQKHCQVPMKYGFQTQRHQKHC